MSADLTNLAASLNDCSVYEHERVPFPTYPYEWPPEMLHAAGIHTLDIAGQCLDEGFGLKDASPYNILFRGPDPVFVDALSFEQRDPHDPTWLAYGQFMRNFSLPLLANNHLGIQIDQIFRTRRDGIAPAELCSWAGPLRRMRPHFFSMVTLPYWLSKFENDRLYVNRSMASDQSRFVLRSLFQRLRRTLHRLEPRPRTSAWSAYGDHPDSYTAAQSAKKQAFVEAFLDRCRPNNLLDVGCNTGVFSLMAAGKGAAVVALDADSTVVGRLWRSARERASNILPLVVDIARPTPALGWRNQENISFLSRAQGAFDAVLLLAMIHHLLVTECVPLDQIIALAADLTTRYAVIEYIGPDDPMIHRLARGRDHLLQGLTVAAFENVCREHFEIVEKTPLPECPRLLYLLVKR
ncbi:MAG TPA: methyltransferase domain-containing protein [Bryobacteraceae bacterium]|nr:methyltransferase domain-containing protein [Bryobacteraceae bacterium]